MRRGAVEVVVAGTCREPCVRAAAADELGARTNHVGLVAVDDDDEVALVQRAGVLQPAEVDGVARVVDVAGRCRACAEREDGKDENGDDAHDATHFAPPSPSRGV